jgi:hypothetical protein
MKKTIGIILVTVLFCLFFGIVIHLEGFLAAIQIFAIQATLLALVFLLGWLFYEDND